MMLNIGCAWMDYKKVHSRLLWHLLLICFNKLHILPRHIIVLQFLGQTVEE